MKGCLKDFYTKYRIGSSVIKNIKNKKTYKNITSTLVNPGEVRRYKLYNDDIEYIKTSNESNIFLSKKFRVSDDTIRKIKTNNISL